MRVFIIEKGEIGNHKLRGNRIGEQNKKNPKSKSQNKKPTQPLHANVQFVCLSQI